MFVTHSKKENNSLSGAIPTELGLMTDLTHLVLGKLARVVSLRATHLFNRVPVSSLAESYLEASPFYFFCHLAVPCSLFIPKKKIIS
jgi:hypothetical protein